MFFAHVITKRQSAKDLGFEVRFSRSVEQEEDSLIKIYPIPGENLFKFSEKFAATIKTCAENFDQSHVEILETEPVSVYLPVEEDELTTLQTFRTLWAPFVEKSFFELTRDPSFKRCDSSLTKLLFDAKIDSATVADRLKSIRKEKC